MSQPEQRSTAFLALTFTVALAAAGLLTLQLEQLASEVPGADRTLLGWPVITIAYTLAAALRLRFSARDHAESMALFELPVLAALFFSDHTGLVIGAVVGTSLGLLIRGVRAPLAIAFGTAQVTLAAELGLAVFHPISGGVHDATTRPLLAAAAAVLVARFSYVALAMLAASLRGQLSSPAVLRRALAITAVQVFTTGSIGLISIVVLFHAPQFSALLAVPVAASYVGARAYSADLRRLDELEFLRQSTEILNASPVAADAMDGLLDEVRSAFAANHAEVVLLEEVDDLLGPSRRAIHHRTDRVRLAPWRPNRSDLDLLDRIHEVDGLLVSLQRGHMWLHETPHRDVMACCITSDGQVHGALIVAGPVNGDPFSMAQLDLLKGLARTTASTLRAAQSQRAALEAAGLRERLRVQAATDPLTGLPNRGAFVAAVDAALAAGTPFSLLHVDLDDFRSINQGLGQEAGDRLLVEMGQRLGAAVRPGDVIARLGADEFAVLLATVSDRAGIALLTERLQHSLRRRLRLDETPIDPTATIGSDIVRVGDTAASLLGRAALATSWAKREQPGHWLHYRDEMTGQATAHLALRTDLLQALDQGDLDVHFQPFHAIDDARVVGAEALVRWQHATRGAVSPAEFIPIAEDAGLIDRVGRFVLTRSVERLAIWQHEHGARIVISINLSAAELEDASLVPFLRELLERTAVDPALVMLEITERDLMRDTEGAVGRLNALKALGVQLAIDDFGTGYSSLAYLQQFPVDVIKIAKEFVDRVDDPRDRGVVARAVIELAHALGMRTLAEAIETRAQHHRLRELGCEIGQGWLWSRAEPDVQFSARLLTDGWASDAAPRFVSRAPEAASELR